MGIISTFEVIKGMAILWVIFDIGISFLWIEHQRLAGAPDPQMHSFALASLGIPRPPHPVPQGVRDPVAHLQDPTTRLMTLSSTSTKGEKTCNTNLSNSCAA